MSNATPPRSRQLVGHARIQGTMALLSGLHIGAGKDDIEIGGNDNPVIRDPLTDLPYVPGSSLKGRLRSILELRDGHYDSVKGEPGGCAREDCYICRVFGPHKRTNHTLGPSRIIVRDSFLAEKSHNQLNGLAERGLSITEMKSENMIRRTTGVADNPRSLERVPAGVEFTLDISVRLFDDDNREKILGLITDGLALLEADTFGASGSRGSGHVRFDYTVSLP